MKHLVSAWSLGGSLIIVLIGGLLAAPRAAALPEKPNHITFKVQAAPADPFSDANAASAGGKLEVRRGEMVLVKIEGTPELGWHTYPLYKKAPDQLEAQLSKLWLKDTKYFAALWPATESEPELVEEPGSGKLYEYPGAFTWTQQVLVRSDAPAGQELKLEIGIKLEVCEKQCVWENHILTVPISISTKEALPLSPDVAKTLEKYNTTAAAQRRTTDDKTLNSSPSSPNASTSFSWQDLPVVDSPKLVADAAAKDASLWGTIVTAVLGGFISLLTPCVFPMIPVTVSFFLHQGERSHRRPMVMATVYCATIVAVLTVGGMVLVRVLQVISQHYITNIFLTSVFIFFALSLLGMYEIELPSSLANLTGSREGKGGLLGIVFMALTFSIISFACVGPIYGGFITLEASHSSVTNTLQRFLGPFAFSLAFASPFFVLALFPTLLRSLPKSGSWMNSVKVVMGFLELAAAFKFVRAAELSLRGTSDYFTFDLCLGIYISLCVACGLYLFNVYRLPHDHEAAESIGVLRLVFGVVFLSLALYLLPGMFKEDREHSQKPRGVAYEWVRSFLLPDERSDWQADLGSALVQAERENKPVFIDFTGVTCPNCRLNESRIFSQPRIQALFQQFVTVQLHTDTVPAGVHQVPDAEGSAQFRDGKFHNDALPYYVVLKPQGRTLEKLAVYDKGLINTPEEFADFLNRALAAAR